jgi:hypothetical protein
VLRSATPPKAVRLPVPKTVNQSNENPAGLNRNYVSDGTIYSPAGAAQNLSPTHNRATYWHEVGHIVDALMPDQMRQVIARDILGGNTDQWDSEGGDYVHSPESGTAPLREEFADAYAALMQTRPGKWDEAYKQGWVGDYPGNAIPLKKMEQLRQVLSTLASDPRFKRQP